MKKKKGLLCLIIFFAALLLAPALQAQETIRGTLRSATGEAVAGATVTVKGTSNAVSSDNNGSFSIVAPVGSVLTITSVGFAPREVTVTGTQINEVLQIADATLTEVVVIGYQTVRRSDLTGAVSVVSASDVTRN